MRAQGESGHECVISEIAKGCKTKEVMLWQFVIPITNTNLKNICSVVKDYNKYKNYIHLDFSRIWKKNIISKIFSQNWLPNIKRFVMIYSWGIFVLHNEVCVGFSCHSYVIDLY